jgi:hypothetical protein
VAIGTVVAPPVALLASSAAVAVDDPGAPAFSTFSGRATADGVRTTLSVKDYLVVEDFVDGGGPTASASLDSLGESTAFSSLPYPGSTAVTFPGVVSTLTGKSVPTYPFVVTSQYPSTPDAQVRQPGYLMQAHSSETDSSAATQAGATTTSGDEYGSISTAVVEAIGGTFTSAGEARTRLSVGAFTLSGAVSRAAISRTADGRVVKSSSFETSAIHVGDLVIGVTDRGLVAGPQDAPLDPARQVSDAITSAGVTVRFLPAVQTADSVLSSGLEVSMERPLDGFGNAKGVVSYVVGRTFAQADATATAPATGTPVASDAAPAAPAAAPVLPVTDAAAVPGAVAVADTPSAVATVPTATLVNAGAIRADLTGFSAYPILAALVPVAVLAVVGARRFS